MDTHTTLHRSPASTTTVDRLDATAGRGALLLLTLAATAWATWAPAQTTSEMRPRPAERRPVVTCGGDQLDGVCAAWCSGNPLERLYDADCFSCDQLTPPEPKRACMTPDEPCEIHEGIARLGMMVASGRYDDRLMRDTVLAYWDASAWDLSVHWGASSLDGFVVYSVVRAALEFEPLLENHPTTRMAMACMLRDHADRGVPTTADNGRRMFHGGATAWNSWSEDYIGFAVGLAAADAWLSAKDDTGEYFDDYYASVGDAIDAAFSVSDGAGPLTLTVTDDPDPDSTVDGPSVMLRNHGEYSPVYATVVLKHLTDVNAIYRAAGLPPYVTCDSKPATFDDLYRWLLGKIEPNPEGAGYVFRSDGCQRSDGQLSYCDDRPGDPPGTAGAWREPGHYPLAASLPELCVAEGIEMFSASCEWVGPAGIEQTPYSWVFNCVFTEEVGAWSQGIETTGQSK